MIQWRQFPKRKEAFFQIESKGQTISEIFQLLVEMLKSLKKKSEPVIPSLQLSYSSFDFKMVSLSLTYYSTEDLKIEVLQPKKLIIYNLKFEKDSMHFGILSRDYLNTALSGENI